MPLWQHPSLQSTMLQCLEHRPEVAPSCSVNTILCGWGLQVACLRKAIACAVSPRLCIAETLGDHFISHQLLCMMCVLLAWAGFARSCSVD